MSLSRKNSTRIVFQGASTVAGLFVSLVSFVSIELSYCY